MTEEIINDSSCIVKAFENHPISIISEQVGDKKIYYFRASDIGKALNLSNIAVSIQHFDEDERVIRKAYDTTKRIQDTVFLSSQGVYRQLFNSKKPEAKKFRKWAGNILDDIIFNDSKELKRQLDEKDKLIEKLENKPETEGFQRKPGEIYMAEDTEHPGRIKVGYANESDDRLYQLNVSSSCKTIKLYAKFKTFDKILAEKLIHHCLQPFRIRGRAEWFFFKNDLEIAYAINSITKILDFIEFFDIKDYDHFKQLTIDLDVEKELEFTKTEAIKELEKDLQLKVKGTSIKMKKARQQGQKKSGDFKGTSYVSEKKLWCAQLQYNYKQHFLGYYSDEIDAAKVYNDYASFLNQTENTEFLLNDIPGYITVPRNIPVEILQGKQTKKSSKYNGVSYDTRRKHYVAGIQLSGKTYNLGNSLDEIVCARIWNQQALYFNNTLNTKYILNDINEKCIPKDFRPELLENKQNKKTSKYYGVSFSTAKKWVCSYMMNRKKIHIGTYETELEACQAYNNVVIELNKTGCKYKVNTL